MKYIDDPYSEMQGKKNFNSYFTDRYVRSESRMRVIVLSDSSEHEKEAGVIHLHFKPGCKFSAEVGIVLKENLTASGLGKLSLSMILKEVKSSNQLNKVFFRAHKDNEEAKNFCNKFRKINRRFDAVDDMNLWVFQLK